MHLITGWLCYGTEYGRPFEWDGPEKCFLIAGGGDVSDCFNFDGGGTRIRTKNEGITGRTTTGTEPFHTTWGHGEDCVAKCDCLDSDRTGAYVHCLIPKTDLTDLTPRDKDDNKDCGYLGVGRAGSIPFVSEKPGAYGRLLLAVYVQWRTGLLISSDWLRPVTRGAWRAVLLDRVEEPNPVHGPGESS